MRRQVPLIFQKAQSGVKSTAKLFVAIKRRFEIMSAVNYRLKLLSALFLLAGTTGFAHGDPLGSPLQAEPDYNFAGSDSAHSLDFFDKRDRHRGLDKTTKLNPAPVPGQNLSKNSKNLPNFNDLFDGSEFNASTFIDTDFSKQSFIDLFGSSEPKEKGADFIRQPSDDTAGTDQSRIELARKNKVERDKKIYRDFIKPVYYLPGDWVPSSLDSVWNGGFTTPPDNGSPVPYRLNGHVDIQRALPWQD